MPPHSPREAAQVMALAADLLDDGEARLDEHDVTLRVDGVTGYIGLRFTRVLVPFDEPGWSLVRTGVFHLTLANSEPHGFSLEYDAYVSLVNFLARFIREERLEFAGLAISLFDADGALLRCILPLSNTAESSQRLYRAVQEALPEVTRLQARPRTADGMHLSVDGPVV